MQIVQLGLAALACGCALTHGPADGSKNPEPRAESRLHGELQEPILPPPTGPLELVLDQETTLLQILQGLAEITGQHVVMSGQAEAQLLTRPVVLGGTSEIPADEVYEFVEGLLVFHGFYLAPIKGGERPILGVYSRENSRLARRFVVPADRLETFAKHPALLLQTTIELPHTDVRQLSTSLRAMLTDTNTQLLLPVGSHGLLLGAPSQHLIDLVGQLKRIDEAELGKADERRKAVPEGKPAGASQGR